MDPSPIDAIRTRLLLSGDASNKVSADERPIIVRELPGLLVSRIFLRQFIQAHDSQTSPKVRRLSDDVVYKAIEGGLEILSDSDLATLLISIPDLEHMGDCIYTLGGEHRRAKCWWEASVAEGERLIYASGRREFHERVMDALEKKWN